MLCIHSMPKYKIEQTVVLTACADGFVQEWIHGKEKYSAHQELFYKRTKDFLDRMNINRKIHSADRHFHHANAIGICISR